MSSKIKLRKVQAQRKFAQGAYVPLYTNNTIERRGEHEKAAAPSIIVQNVSAASLLDQISFQNIHVHEKNLLPVVRLERLASPQRMATPARVATPTRAGPKVGLPPPPSVAFRSILSRPKKRVSAPMTKKLKRLERSVLPQPKVRAVSVSSSAQSLSVIARSLVKERVLRNGIRKSRVTTKKKLKTTKKLLTSRRLRGQREAARCTPDDTDDDDTPLTLLAQSKSKTANEQAEAPPAASTPSESKEGYYSADNIVRWLFNSDNECPVSTAPNSPIVVGASSALFKVPLPPKDRRRSKRNDPQIPTPLENEAVSASSPGPVKPSPNSAKSPPDTSTVKSHEGNRSAAETAKTTFTCPSQRYVTVRDVVTAPAKERELRCNTCKYCKCADKVEKLSKVVENITNPQDVYEFDETDEAESGPMLLREFRSRHVRNGHPDFYLDTGSPHIITICRDNMKSKKMFKAKLVERKNISHVPDSSLLENEPLFDSLLKTVDGVTPPMQRLADFRKSPSPPASEITVVKYQHPISTVVDEVGCVKGKRKAGAIKTKQKLNSRKRLKSLPSRTGSSKPATPSTSKTPTRATKTTTKRAPVRHTPYSKIPTRTTRNLIENAAGSPPLAVATPVAGPSRAPDAVSSVRSAVAGPPSVDAPGIAGPTMPDPKKSTAVVREAPVYYPTEEEFNDPIAYFENIMPTASKFGICKVVAPASFKPKYAIYDKIRFNVANQYIARLYIRWGQASKEMCAIKAHLASQRVSFTRAPLMDNLEVDLPRLYRTVQRLGGLKKVIEKKRWGRVAEEMRFMKGAKLDKKLDDLYVKYLLPYDTLSSQERESIKMAVNKAWHKKNERIVERAQDPLHRKKQLLGECQSSSDTDEEPEEIACALTEAEDCIVTGRRMTLNNYAKVAKAVQDTYFPNTPQPTPQEVEDEYWRIVLLAAEHICVNTASIDTGDDGFGFSKNRNDPFGRHPWNLKMISQNPGNVLHMLGRVLGVTVPTLHLGMVFSTSCWHRDPHGLPWIEYMHSGPSKIWYGIPDEQSSAFRKAVATLCPTACQNKSIWLPSDITMIPPNFLLTNNVSLTRVEQNPNEYIIVFPKAYSSSISTGHTTSESVYFATKSWLKTVDQVFQELRESCEPTMFALEQLLISVASDPRAPPSLLQMVHTTLASIVEDEKQHRLDLTRLGVVATTATRPLLKKKPNGAWNVREQDECEVCRSTLYLSKVTGLPERDSAVCLNHALLLLKSKKEPRPDLSQLILVVYLVEDQLDEVMAKLQNGFVPIR